MTCRHDDPINNPNCSSYAVPSVQLERLARQEAALKEKFKIPVGPDNSDFEILDFIEHGCGIALKVQYKSCPNCSYEGTKVLVYIGAGIRDVMKWKVIDPHFSNVPADPRCAWSPDARFPASECGWKNAELFLDSIGR